MSRKIVIVVLAVLVCNISAAMAGNAAQCIAAGRALMFNGRLSGLRLACYTFDECLNNPACPDCNTSRELKFLHALTRAVMLVVRDNNEPIDSALELARAFDVYVSGDYWAPYFEPLGLEFDHAANSHDAYEIPPTAPDPNEIRNIIDTSMIPEIDAIVAELDSISDSPTPFRIFFDPNETRIFFTPASTGLEHNLEVDYGDLFLFKGILLGIKAQLLTQLAHDLCVDANDLLIEKVVGDAFDVNADLLDSHPHFGKVLPTPNWPDPNGRAMLAQAALDCNTAISYFLNAVEYISNETDAQEDDLLSIDPNARDVCNAVIERLDTMHKSIVEDTVGEYPLESTRVYHLFDPCSPATWQLELNFDLLALPSDDPGVLFALDNEFVPSPWRISYFDIDANTLEIELDYDVSGYWAQGVVTADISQDRSTITNGTFTCWGDFEGTISNVTGQLEDRHTSATGLLDLNPIFGSSARYPNPVNPRDLLPAFDHWNDPLPNTIGAGLGNDSTLGGILPQMTQRDWQLLGDLQPAGQVELREIYPWQRGLSSGFVDIWLLNQRILEDTAGDTDGDVNQVFNADIQNFYMAFDDDYLYGLLTFHDFNTATSDHASYDIFLNYTPDDTSRHSIHLYIWADYGYSSVSGALFYMDDYWSYVGEIDTRLSAAGVEFKIPWYSLPGYLPGRFLSVESSVNDNSWYLWEGEENGTHLQVMPVGSISGTVTYNNYRGGPIFVQAYTDPYDPEDSIVASTVIDSPGPYTLDGIGLGWDGYVRAFAPLFGFNLFAGQDPVVEDSVPVFLWTEHLDGFDLVLNAPVVLESDVPVTAEFRTDRCDRHWYAFDAIQGATYSLDIERTTAEYACASFLGRDGQTEIAWLPYWDTQYLDWICPLSGRYYVVVDSDYDCGYGGEYTISMVADTICPTADVASSDWVGVKDCKVDFYDFAVLVSNWLDSGPGPYWPDNTDFNASGRIDFADLAVLADQWRQEVGP